MDRSLLISVGPFKLLLYDQLTEKQRTIDITISMYIHWETCTFVR